MGPKRMSRRHFVASCAGMASGLLVAACAPKVVKETVIKEVEKVVKETVIVQPTAAAAEPVTIKFFVGWGTGNSPEQMPVQELLAQSFHELHPEITVEYIREPWTAGHPKWFTLVAAGTPADGALPIGVGGINEAGLAPDHSVWLDIEPLLERDGVRVDDFHAASIEGATNPFTHKLLGMPVGLYVSFIAYNKALLAEAGHPEPPHDWNDRSWTYERMLEYAQALTVDRSGKRSTEVGFNPEDIEQFGLYGREPNVTGRTWGGEFMTEDARRVTFDSPEFMAGYQFLADLVYKYYVSPTAAQTSEFFAGMSPFLTGRVGMAWSNSWDLGSYKRIEDFEWDAAPCPWGPVINGARMCIDCGALTAEGKHIDTAWEYLKYLSKPGNSERLAIDSYNCLPPRISGQALYLNRAAEAYPGVDAKAILEGLKCARHIEAWRPPVEWGPVFNGVFDALWLGQKTAVECAAEVAPKVQALWDEYWAQF